MNEQSYTENQTSQPMPTLDAIVLVLAWFFAIATACLSIIAQVSPFFTAQATVVFNGLPAILLGIVLVLIHRKRHGWAVIALTVVAGIVSVLFPLLTHGPSW